MTCDAYSELAELYRSNEGRVVTIEGLKWVLTTSEYDAVYPTRRRVLIADLDASPDTMQTEEYKRVKRELGDDWSFDPKHEACISQLVG